MHIVCVILQIQLMSECVRVCSSVCSVNYHNNIGCDSLGLASAAQTKRANM